MLAQTLRQSALTHTADALAMAQRVKQGEATSADIAHLIEFAKQHGGIDYAHRRMEELRAECLDLIADFRHTGVRTALAQYVDFVIGSVFIENEEFPVTFPMTGLDRLCKNTYKWVLCTFFRWSTFAHDYNLTLKTSYANQTSFFSLIMGSAGYGRFLS